MKYGSWHPDAPLPISRGYSNVSVPTYFIHEALPEKSAGVAVVILPGVVIMMCGLILRGIILL